MVDTYAVAGGPTPQALVVGVRKLFLKQSKIKNRRASPLFPAQNGISLPVNPSATSGSSAAEASSVGKSCASGLQALLL